MTLTAEADNNETEELILYMIDESPFSLTRTVCCFVLSNTDATIYHCLILSERISNRTATLTLSLTTFAWNGNR